MGNELIYRCDCNFFNETAGTEEMIRELMDEYGLTWQANIEDNNFDEDKIYEFAYELVQKCQNYIDSAEAVTDDEYFAFKCSKCGNIYIEDGAKLYSSVCPVCGTKRKKYENY